MSTANITSTEAGTPTVVAKLSPLDQFLPVWIIAAMLAGLVAGQRARPTMISPVR